MKRWIAGSIPSPNDGAPPVLTALPSGFRIFVAVSSCTEPAASSTLGSARTRSRSDAGTDGAWAVVPSKEMSGAFPVIAASVPAYDSEKIVSNAELIVSVRT